ncbi:ABC1 kinase family protein [Syntrophobacter fumaroxidans]|uniref:ABC-1 domain protein n=1 Tax=Syntrophobacter fumaroxidans (strain DSM 10017 / MPOB) TaxID=335543 RepID=A0LEU2_SYNFM|nr:AarF/UbiB family protein [Syntrophobacter fumaroxidans]ABK15944.1 ABC-1 domain protein [Syntrophobacter fumaroxidans MPOB]
MTISLKPEHLKRYKDLVWLLVKYGRSDIISQAGLDTIIPEQELPSPVVSPKVDELPHDLEKLGPTYIKLGQFLSTRSDLLPPQYLEALSRLQDSAEQFPFEKVEEILILELGQRTTREFASFDPVPLAAASLAQVHRAVLRDGRLVAVKVQRPGIRRRVIQDLEAFDELAEFLERHLSLAKRFMLQATVAEFRKAVMRELDFRQEAQNLIVLARNLRDYDLIVVPTPIEEYSSTRVLTMDYLEGRKLTTIGFTEPLAAERSKLADHLFRAYLQQIFLDGFYHADPHPGNLYLTGDGRLALVDLGMVARISGASQQKLLRMMVAIGEGRSEEAAEFAVELGEKTLLFDEKRFRKEISDLIIRYQRATIKEIQAGKILLELLKAAGNSGIRFPSEFTMLGKTLMNLDAIGRILDPSYDPNAALRRYSGQLLRQRIRKTVSAANVFEMLIDSQDFLRLLPKRIGKIIDLVAENRVRMQANVIDEKYLMTGLQKIANRLTLGLILAALIVGAALMMRIRTEFTLFGYPGIPILFFLVAVIGSLALVFSIVIHDERVRRMKRPRDEDGEK